MKKGWALFAVMLGLVFLALGIFYWMTPASHLPSWLPGYDPAMAGVHFKHGLVAVLLGILLFIYAWFATGKKSGRHAENHPL